MTQDGDFLQIAVVGAGSWGTALANLLATKGHHVDLWAFEPELVANIKENHENHLFLPGHELSPNLHASGDLAAVVGGKKLVVMVVPSHVFRSMAEQMVPYVTPETVIVTASKGIEIESDATMTEILEQTFDELDQGQFAALSGPSFAKEVVKGIPTVVAVSSKNEATAEFVQGVFVTPTFRVYTNHDVVGVEIGGAIKNVIAIASGMVDGMGLGSNTRAALITRGIAEIRRLGVELGADPATFSGLTGIGDLILTATGTLSRNYQFGKKIGEGKSVDEILSQTRMVVEGYRNTKTTWRLAQKKGVQMPITEAVYEILYNGLAPDVALHRLMTRDLRNELEL